MLYSSGLLKAMSLLVAATVTLGGYVPFVRAASVDELKQQQEQIQLQVQRIKQKENAQKSVAQQAAEKAQEVSTQIDQVQGGIQATVSTIQTTQSQIDQRNQDIATQESSLRRIKDQQDALLRRLYIHVVSISGDLQVFSNESVSKRTTDQVELTAIKKSLASVYAKTNSAKLAVEGARSDLVAKSNSLAAQKAQQEQQQQRLADFQATQTALQQNAEQEIQNLKNQEKAFQEKDAKIQEQISLALTAAINARQRGTFSGGGAGVGARVHRGDFVSIQGNTGYSFGDHVHFETRLNNQSVNPQPYLNNGTLAYPLQSFTITQGFGYTQYGYLYAHGFHPGVDMAGPIGSQVFASADGTVILHQAFGAYGNAWAEQLDNGLVVLYGHLRY
jgi:septal ring factor EnvC (AmiA/AmiB activator)